MTEISKKKSLEKKQQIDRMMDDGLGAGRIVEEEDKEKLASEREKEELKDSKKEHREENNGSMATDIEEVEKLGKEMEQMKTNKELKDSGQVPDPIQDQKSKNKK
jgi:bifunctional N-acetylglucosamine-1-phosphate-uridyltransferase/glucosamine-1-phosphate-acetyltransferase GlmU-like protein